ncbi:equilibrative nucleotide transporter 3-like [Vicia villosa]|uniref:equilibrative nucleotide transporter 3-like n=1 Tax=Vicia villosa TaxID=3911 RepID=UPI00273A8B92|nr:equilibrative nucleotide transporter 3-like [Vicia villosa]
MEAVLPIEVEIPSLRILMEAKLSEVEWCQARYDQLNLIEEKRMTALCHGQLYLERMKRALDKKVRPRRFKEGDLVLKKILPLQPDARGKWAPNYEGPYVVKRVFSGGALTLTTMDGKYLAIVVCWILGNGFLFAWKNMLTIQDYYVYLFPIIYRYLCLLFVRQDSLFLLIRIRGGEMDGMDGYGLDVNTRLRNLIGYSFFFFTTLLVLVFNLSTNGKGGVGPFVCTSGLFGVVDAHVQGGMMGDLFYMNPKFIRSFLARVAAFGALTSTLRILTKSIFEKSKDGLRRGATTFLMISSVFEHVCLLLYAFVFPNIPIVEYYRKKAASEGDIVVSADVDSSGIQRRPNQNDGSAIQEKKGNKQLLMENNDYLLDMFMIYGLTFSIYPGFLSEDTGAHNNFYLCHLTISNYE